MKPPKPATAAAWRHWCLAVLYVVLIFSFQSSYAILSRSMGESLGLSVADIGLIGSVYTWCFAATQMLAGPLLDRVGAQKTIPVACTLFTLGVFCFGFAEGLYSLLLSQVLLATGASFGFIGAGFVGGLWFPAERYGIMFSWVQFTVSIAACLAQMAATHLIGLFPWNWIVNGVGMLGLGLVLIYMAFLRDPPHLKLPGWPRQPVAFVQSVTGDLLGALRQRGMLATVVVGAASFGPMLAMGVVWGPRLGESLGFSLQGSSMASATWLGLAIGAPTFAKLASRGKCSEWLLAGYMTQVILLAWTIGWPARTLEGFAGQMFAFGLASGASILPFTLAATLVGPRGAGTSAALVNGAQFVIGGVLMSLPAQVLGTQWFPSGQLRHALMLLPALMLAVLPFFMALPRNASATRREAQQNSLSE